MNKAITQTDLLKLLPDWYGEVLDYQQICETEQEKFDALALAIDAVAQNFFFQTMDAGAVGLWEQVFGIISNPATETLAFRRSRVLNRVSTRPPFTLGFLHQKLDELIGPGQWTVTVDYPHYTLYVESSAENQLYATEVAYTVGRIKPAHIVFKNTPFLRAEMHLTESIELFKRMYNYRLGSWGLGVGPFASEENQGVIKLPAMPSIQEALLADTAGFVAGDIAKARINGSVVIEGLTKAVSGAALTVTYEVTAAQAAEITRTELLDANDVVLTASTVYVPVEGETVMKHTIPIKEGVNTDG